MHLIMECSSSSNALMICINHLGMLIVRAIGSANASFLFFIFFFFNGLQNFGSLFFFKHCMKVILLVKSEEGMAM